MYCKPNLSSNLNQFPKKLAYFKEEVLNETIEIDYIKPDIENILDVLITPEILSYKIVNTQAGKSNEGQLLTGYKLVIEVKIHGKVTYVANECRQSVHSQTFETMKSMFVIIPSSVGGVDACDLVRAGKIQVNPYLEAVKFRKLDCKKINVCTMLLVNVTLC